MPVMTESQARKLLNALCSEITNNNDPPPQNPKDDWVYYRYYVETSLHIPPEAMWKWTDPTSRHMENEVIFLFKSKISTSYCVDAQDKIDAFYRGSGQSGGVDLTRVADSEWLELCTLGIASPQTVVPFSIAFSLESYKYWRFPIIQKAGLGHSAMIRRYKTKL